MGTRGMKVALVCWMMVHAVSACAGASSPRASSPRMDPTVAPRAQLEESLRAHGTLTGRAPLTVSCRGTLNDLGHYARPRQLEAYPVRRATTFDFGAGVIAQRSHLQAEGQEMPSEAYVGPQRSLFVDFGETAPRPDRPGAEVRLHHQLTELVPSLLITLALAEAAELRALPAGEVAGRATRVVAFVDAAGQPRTFHFDTERALLLRSEVVLADDLFGDTRIVTDYAQGETKDGLVLPRALTRSRSWFVEEELQCALDAERVELGALPEPVAPKSPHVTVEPLGHGLHLVKLHHLNNRTMFLEGPDAVVAFEAPLDSATGELLLDTIARTTGDKPVRYLVLSHHHPDYIGGIRPFIARGATIVTTPGNVAYVQEIARAPRTVQPDALAKAPKDVAIQVVHGKLSLGEGEQRVELYDIGAHSHHTDEYLVHYVPAARLLFEGDLLGPRTESGGPLSRRGRGLLEAIDELALEVEFIYESWPLYGVPDARSLTKLRQLLAAESTPVR